VSIISFLFSKRDKSCVRDLPNVRRTKMISFANSKEVSTWLLKFFFEGKRSIGLRET
jgi:hypothetical protein